jgi:hypothetical protein
MEKISSSGFICVLVEEEEGLVKATIDAGEHSICHKGVLVDVLFHAKDKAAQAQVCYEP